MSCQLTPSTVCFAAMGPGHLSVILLIMNSSVYQNILDSNVRTSVWQLNLAETESCNMATIPNIKMLMFDGWIKVSSKKRKEEPLKVVQQATQL